MCYLMQKDFILRNRVTMHDTDKKHREIKEYLWPVWKSSERYSNFIVELSHYEVEGAYEIGKKRFENSRLKNSKSPILSNKSSPNKKRDILGVLGEFAAIKWLQDNNYNPDMSAIKNTEYLCGEDDTFDTSIVVNNKKYFIEIKTTKKPVNSKLIYPYHKGNKENQPDIFILVCQVTEEKYVIKGFTTPDKLLNNIDSTIPVKAYTIHEKKLNWSIEEILNKFK